MSTFDFKTLTTQTSGMNSSSLLFGALNGQGDTAPVPFTGAALTAFAWASPTITGNASIAGQLFLGGATTTYITSDGAQYYIFSTGLGNATVSINNGNFGTTYPTVTAAALGAFGFSTGNAATGTVDTGFTRRAAANISFGSVDAAAPVAQTLSVQSVVTGTADTAGADWTLALSKSTGLKDGGRLAISATPGGTTGSTVNTAVSAFLTVDANNNLALANAANACLFYVYNTRDAVGTKLTNYERLEIGPNAGGVGANVFGIVSVKGGTGTNRNLAIQTSSGVMTLNDGNATITISSGIVQMPSRAIATATPNTQAGTSYAMATADASLIFSNAGTVTLTLLAAASWTGRWLHVKNIGAGTLVSASSNVSPIGSATPGTAILAAGPGKWAELQSDGSNWIVMASN